MPSQNEGRLSLALQAYRDRKFTSIRATAKAYDVNYETLRLRHHGIPARAETTTNSRKLTNLEEEVLLQKILDLVTQGHHPRRVVVEEMANTMLHTKNPSQPQRVGTKWVANFVKRHPELTSIYNRKFDYQRAACEDPEEFGKWFERFRKTIAEYGVVERVIYNFDETGFMMGIITPQSVVTGSERRGGKRNSLQDGINQLVKGSREIAHQMALMQSEINELRRTNEALTKRKSRKRKYIQLGGSLTSDEASQLIPPCHGRTLDQGARCQDTSEDLYE